MMSVIIHVGNVLFDRKIRQTFEKTKFIPNMCQPNDWPKPSTLSKQTYAIDFD